MTADSIIVLGGTGFVGRKLVARLAALGHRVTVLSRNLTPHRQQLVPPGVQIVTLDVYDPGALQAAFAGADTVINLVGILNERGNSGRGFRLAHVTLTKLVIAAMQLAGVRRLLQMSALNAGRGRSHYLKSRGDADAAVKASGLDWTIFQPSVIFGPDDGLFCRFARLLALTPVLPLARASCKFAPVCIDDVVNALIRTLRLRRSIGEVYELYGPEVFTLAQLVHLTASQRGLRRIVLPLPDALGRLQARLCDGIPGKPFSSDNFRSLQTDSVGGIDGLHRLGIDPAHVRDRLPEILGHGQDRQSRLTRYRERR